MKHRKNHLSVISLFVLLFTIMYLPIKVHAQQFGFAENGVPNCSPQYNGSIDIGGDNNQYGYEDTSFNGQANSCFIQQFTHQFGFGENGTPFCSPGFNLDPVTGGDGLLYAFEDTDFNGSGNSCLVQQLSHQYGFGENGTPFCAPGFNVDPEIGGDGLSYGFQDTDLDGSGNSCLIQVSHRYGFGENGTPFCAPGFNVDPVIGGDGLAYAFQDTDFDGEGNSCLVQAGNGGGNGGNTGGNGGNGNGGGSNTSEQLTHFGQNITLNGANVAWVNFGFDVGTSTPAIGQLRDRFAQIRAAGGNSARWWLHASGWMSPDINPGGFVRGISPNTQNGVSDAQMIDQVRQVLDAAWAEGILLNISLFSFEIMCGEDNDENGSVHRGSRFNNMVNNNNNVQSYIDNVLEPLVVSLRDHPALFSWEIFNESDGMTAGGRDFLRSNCPNGNYPQPLSVLQNFVNQAAGRIQRLDRNVKVTTSVSQFDFLNDYTNATLTSLNSSDPEGVLDYYQAHWYWRFNHPSNPYVITASDRGFDLPLVMGEFGEGVEPETGTPDSRINSALLNQGYAGAWIWDQTGLPISLINTIISGASSFSPPIDRAAVEECIATRDPSCYNQ